MGSYKKWLGEFICVMLFFVMVSAFMFGCATAQDPIDHLVTDLTSSHGFWINGIGHDIDLPQTASTEQVIKQVFQTSFFEKGQVTNYTILKIRQVKIPVSSPKPSPFTAVLCQTDLGKKIVLLRFQEDFGWWNRAYDVRKGPYNEKRSS